MATVLRANISRKNPYYISKDRFYELKHFCLQYKDWVRAYQNARIINSKSLITVCRAQDGIRTTVDPVVNAIIDTERFVKKMKLVEQSAMEADPELYSWIIKGVTDGLPFTSLQMVHGIPCCKDTYYDRYRKFFWILSQKKD